MSRKSTGRKQSRRARGLAAAAAVVVLLACSPDRPTAPDGAAHEPWLPRILEEDAGLFLPDYSYAGYRWGEREPPRPPVTLEVTAFGAQPDDGRDDTDAFARAIAAADGLPGQVVIGIPRGRFDLSQILFLERSRLVLRGAGAGATVLAVGQPLESMRIPEESELLRRELREQGKKGHGRFFSPFAWSGGVLWVRHPPMRSSTRVLEAAGGRRGERVIELASEAEAAPGDVLEVRWFNHEGRDSSLLEHLFGSDRIEPGIRLVDGSAQPLVAQPVTVARTEGTLLHIEEPLLHDLRPAWTPRLVPLDYLEEIGLEGFTVEFPESRYEGHHIEEGWNAIYFTGLQHSWVSDVTIRNADSGIVCTDVKNLTLEGIEVHGRGGHYSVTVGGSYGVLVRNFRFTAPSLHGPSFNAGAQLSVYSGGYAEEATLDQHRGFPMQNLFDDLEIQRSGAEVFDSGGDRDWAPTAGGFTTFWNVRMHLDLRIRDVGARLNRLFRGTVTLQPEVVDAPRARFVGFRGNHPLGLRFGPDPYVEGLNRPGIAVPSLYGYQLDRRLARRSAPATDASALSDASWLQTEVPTSRNDAASRVSHPQKLRPRSN